MSRYKAYFRFYKSDVTFCIEMIGPDWNTVSNKAVELAEKLEARFIYEMDLIKEEWTK